MNYGQLKARIVDLINRSDLTTKAADFVLMSEAVIARDIRVSDMQTLVTGSLVAGKFTTPAGYLEASRLVVGDHVHTYITPEYYQDLTRQNATDKYYTRIGAELYVLNGSTEAYSLLAYLRFDELVSDSDTNWLLTNAQDVYVWQGLKHAAVYMKDAAAAQLYEGEYLKAKSAVNGADARGKVSSSMRIRPRHSF
jgi:hypothetical protein